MWQILFSKVSKVATITSPAPHVLLELCCSPMKRWSLCLLLWKLGGTLWLPGSTQCGASDTVWHWRPGHTNTMHLYPVLLRHFLLEPSCHSRRKPKLRRGRHTLLLSYQPIPSTNLAATYRNNLEIPQHPIQPLQLMQHGVAMRHPCRALTKLQIYKQLNVVLSHKVWGGLLHSKW